MRIYAKEFISLYHADKSGNGMLHSNVRSVLDFICQNGISQSILSASEISILLSQTNEFDIAGYFDEIFGLSDIYAKSKIDVVPIPNGHRSLMCRVIGRLDGEVDTITRFQPLFILDA